MLVICVGSLRDTRNVANPEDGSDANPAVDTLAAFYAGEDRLVFARRRDRPDDPPYYLVDGTARDPVVRALTRESLECLVPECTDRRLKTVNRSEHWGRRDGFAHYPGAGKHAPMGLFHAQGQALIVAWVAEHFPDATARKEARTASGARIADVLVEWPAGGQAAVEIQYAGIRVSEWLGRQQSYLDYNITPVWLLGHHGDQMNPLGDQVVLTLMQRKMIEFGVAVVWLNPVHRTVATPFIYESAHDKAEARLVPPRAATERVHLRIDSIDDCRLDPLVGLTTPSMELLAVGDMLLAGDRAEHLAQQGREATAERERKRAAAEAKRERVERAANEAAERQRRNALHRERRSADERELHPVVPAVVLAATAAASAVARPARWTHCISCKTKLDPLLYPYGYHFGCQPYPLRYSVEHEHPPV